MNIWERQRDLCLFKLSTVRKDITECEAMICSLESRKESMRLSGDEFEWRATLNRAKNVLAKMKETEQIHERAAQEAESRILMLQNPLELER